MKFKSLVPSIIVLLFFYSCQTKNTHFISFNQSSAILEYGASKLETHLKNYGYSLIKTDVQHAKKGLIILSGNDSLHPVYKDFISLNPDIGEDGFLIKKEGDKIYIAGKTDRACLYGLFEIIGQIGDSYDFSKIENKMVNPPLPFRAVKINLPWSPYRPGPTNDLHIETCKDLKFWEAFLDMLVKNRFNAVSLWNNHPFPYMIKAKNYPKATPFNDEELEEWRTFYKTLFKMAKDRGLETYIINWNIVVSPEFAEAYGAKEYFDRSELVKKYTRESVTQLINEYDDLTGIGITLADWMGNWGDEKMTSKEREDWIRETFVEGMKNADRKVKFIHRAVLAGDPKLMREVIDYADLPKKTNVEVKFNWSHGHSTPKLSLTHANDDGTIMRDFWDPKPENFFISWMVRNEDFFVLRWGEPDFIREHIKTNNFDYVQGYFIGSEGYIPAKDYSHIAPHPQKTWNYGFEKQWLFYHLWGRLIYNPDETDEVLAREISRRYKDINETAFLKAYSFASRVPLHIATFYKGTWDFTLYSEGFLSAWQYDFEDGKSPFISLEEMIDHETLDKRYLNIKDYCRLINNGDSIDNNLITPLVLAQTVWDECNKSLDLIDSIGTQNDDPTFQSEIEDMKTWCYLGFYFANKIQAGVSLETYKLTQNIEEKEKALNFAEKCLDNWNKVVELTKDRYKLMPYVIMEHPENLWPDFKGFHWKNYTKEVEADIEFIKNSK